MPTFKNLKDLYKFVEKKIDESLSDEVAKMVKYTEQKHIWEDVYQAYNITNRGHQEPYVYERRYTNGGLMDQKNMVATVKDGTLIVTNETEGQDDIDNLALLVEYGDGRYGEYDYKTNRDDTAYQYLAPRPFTQRTIEEIAEDKLHVKSLKEGLKKRGIKVE